MGQMISQFTPIQRDVFYFYKQFSNTQNGANINDVIRTFVGSTTIRKLLLQVTFLLMKVTFMLLVMIIMPNVQHFNCF